MFMAGVSNTDVIMYSNPTQPPAVWKWGAANQKGIVFYGQELNQLVWDKMN